MLFIAQHEAEGPVRADQIASALRIPRNYLSKTLHRLAQEGILASARGRGGGFLLAIPADRLPLLRVAGLFDTLEPGRQCLLGQPVCSDRTACEAHARWKDVSERVARFFRETMVADLLGPRGTAARRRVATG